MAVTAAVTWAGVSPRSSGTLMPNRAELDGGVDATVGVVVVVVVVVDVVVVVASCTWDARLAPTVPRPLEGSVVVVVVVVVTAVAVVVTGVRWWRPVELYTGSLPTKITSGSKTPSITGSRQKLLATATRKLRWSNSPRRNIA